MPYEVNITDEFREWWDGLTVTQQEDITARVELLEHHGPSLGRPVVDRVTMSAFHNMKELRCSSSGALRVLFTFDPRRQAILLLGGDKTGDWNEWYEQAVPEADPPLHGVPTRSAERGAHRMTSKNSFTDLRDDLYRRSPESRQRVAAKAAELADELGLAQLRAVRERTQSQLADAIGTTQSGVSRIERQQDLMVSTLNDYVSATGGVLRLVASYPEFETEIDLPVLRRQRLRATSPREFRVVWQNQETRKFGHVGWLRSTTTGFSFQYTAEAHLDADFEPFPAFPDLHATYDSVELFPFFANRLAAAVVDRSLPAALGLEDDEATPVELLARSWGRSRHDTIQIVPEPTRSSDGRSTRLFLASGVGHADESDPDTVSRRIGCLQRNDPLWLRDEPDNPINPKAIVLEASGGIVGWVPDYLLDELHKSRDNGNEFSVLVEHSNGPEIPWHLRLLCRLEEQA